jgi:anti-sigma B factor antagonist
VSEEPLFSISRSEREGELVLALRGELDVDGKAEFAAAAARIPAGAHVVIDLSELSFMDSSGLGVLMAMDVRSRADGWTLMLRDPQPAVRRLLEICHFDSRLTITQSAVSRG